MFQKMGRKLRYIETHRARPLVDDLCQLIAAQIKEENRYISNGLIEALQLDTVYGILRNLNWLKTDLFIDLMCNHLATQFRLSRKVIDPLILNCSRRVEQILQIPHHGSDGDASFLRFLVISATQVEGADFESIDFGLGTALMTHIQKARASVHNNQPQTSTVHFSQSIDALLSDVILELHELSISDTSYISNQKLHYLIQETADEFSAVANTEIIQEIYQALKFLSTKEAWESRDVLHFMTKHCLMTQKHLSTEKILQQMFKLQLVFRSARTRNGKMEKWSLSPLGLSLIADLLAADWLRLNSDDYSRLVKQVPCVQKSIIENLQRTEPKSLLPIFETVGDQLSKPALHELLISLRDELHQHQFLALLFDLVQTSTRPWVRSTVCRIVRKLQPSNSASRILREIVKSEQSQQVRDLALSSLMDLSSRDSITVNR